MSLTFPFYCQPTKYTSAANYYLLIFKVSRCKRKILHIGLIYDILFIKRAESQRETLFRVDIWFLRNSGKGYVKGFFSHDEYCLQFCISTKFCICHFKATITHVPCR